MKEFVIDGKHIGKNFPCYLIAEAGANHEGDIKKAFQLIDAAKESGVDAIKFQNYTAEKLTTKNAPKYWNDGIKNESQFDVFSKLDTLSADEWKQIFEYAQKKNITCFSTPFDLESVELLDSFDIPAYKIASFELVDLPLIKYVAATGKPMILSTGMANEQEILDAINVVKKHGSGDFVILHCVAIVAFTSMSQRPEGFPTIRVIFPEARSTLLIW